MDKKQFPDWPTLGKYLRTPPLDDHKKFLETIPFAFQGRISREARHQSWKVKGLFEISAKGNATAREGPGKTGSTDTPGMETSLDRS
jgi:hypothetical protein